MKKSIFKKLAIIAPFAVAAVAMPIALTSCSETSQTTDDGNNEGSGSNNQDQTINVDLSVVGSSINDVITSKVSELNSEANISSTQDSIKSELNAIENMKDSVSSVSISLSENTTTEQKRTATIKVTFNDNTNITGSLSGYSLDGKVLSKSELSTSISGTLKTPEIASKTITLFGSEDELKSTNFNNYVNEKINQEANKKAILNDSATHEDFSGEELSQIKLTCTPSEFEKSVWGNVSYEQWSKGNETTPADPIVPGAKTLVPPTKILYNSTSSDTKILLGSTNLKTYLTDSNNAKLIEIFNAANQNNQTVKLAEAESSTVTIALVENSNIGYTTDGLMHLNVSKTTSSSSSSNQENSGKAGSLSVEYYDLQIPVSCIDLSLANSTLTVSGDNIVSKTITDFTLNFDIGNGNIVDQSKVDYTNDNVSIETSASKIDVDTVLKALKWGKDKAGVPGAGVYEGSTEQTSTLELDSNKIGQDLGIFNTVFSNPVLNSLKPQSSQDKTKIVPDAEGYTITLTATPTTGFTWDDGSKTARTITTGTLNVRVKDAKAEQDATLATYTLNQKFDGGSSLTNEWLTKYFENTDNFNHFVAAINNDDTAKTKFANVDFSFVSLEAPAKADAIEKTGINGSDPVKVKVACTPTAGHSFNDGSINAKEVVVTITSLNDWAKDAKAENDTLTEYTLIERLDTLDNASLTSYFQKDANFKDFVQKIEANNPTLRNSKFANVDFKFKSVKTPAASSAKASPDNLSSVEIILECTSKHGHTFSNGETTAKEVTITITTLNNKANQQADDNGPEQPAKLY